MRSGNEIQQWLSANQIQRFIRESGAENEASDSSVQIKWVAWASNSCEWAVFVKVMRGALGLSIVGITLFFVCQGRIYGVAFYILDMICILYWAEHLHPIYGPFRWLLLTTCTYVILLDNPSTFYKWSSSQSELEYEIDLSVNQSIINIKTSFHPDSCHCFVCEVAVLFRSFIPVVCLGLLFIFIPLLK